MLFCCNDLDLIKVKIVASDIYILRLLILNYSAFISWFNCICSMNQWTLRWKLKKNSILLKSSQTRSNKCEKSTLITISNTILKLFRGKFKNISFSDVESRNLQKTENSWALRVVFIWLWKKIDHLVCSNR